MFVIGVFDLLQLDYSGLVQDLDGVESEGYVCSALMFALRCNMDKTPVVGTYQGALAQSFLSREFVVL